MIDLKKLDDAKKLDLLPALIDGIGVIAAVAAPGAAAPIAEIITVVKVIVAAIENYVDGKVTAASVQAEIKKLEDKIKLSHTSAPSVTVNDSDADKTLEEKFAKKP